ncbi:hypothetical protein BDD12DRAFT_814495 [Trichophaea hybrida]|nr:hypothetical protein BDD12DRAFT_814495 [Trichophaea hybrida]
MATTRSQVALMPQTPLTSPKPSDELPKNLQDTLTSAVPDETLTKLLISHAEAHNPKSPRIVALTQDSVSIFYLQPVREYWFMPLKQTVTIRIAPSLPPVPKSPDEKWISTIASRLTKFAEKDEIPVDQYIPPVHWKEFMTLGVFVGFSLLILAHLFGVKAVEEWVFTTEMRFNIAVGVHCAVLIKRSRDIRQLGELLEKHWKGGRKGRLQWIVSGWIEGWRAVERLRTEVGRVRIFLVAQEEREMKESKKKR